MVPERDTLANKSDHRYMVPAPGLGVFGVRLESPTYEDVRLESLTYS
jgi:hypothetical protein